MYNLFESNHPNSCSDNFKLKEMVSLDNHPLQKNPINPKKSAIWNLKYHGHFKYKLWFLPRDMKLTTLNVKDVLITESTVKIYSLLIIGLFSIYTLCNIGHKI